MNLNKVLLYLMSPKFKITKKVKVVPEVVSEVVSLQTMTVETPSVDILLNYDHSICYYNNYKSNVYTWYLNENLNIKYDTFNNTLTKSNHKQITNDDVLILKKNMEYNCILENYCKEIVNIIGPVTFKISDSIGWHIPKLFKIIIKKYSAPIIYIQNLENTLSTTFALNSDNLVVGGQNPNCVSGNKTTNKKISINNLIKWLKSNLDRINKFKQEQFKINKEQIDKNIKELAQKELDKNIELLNVRNDYYSHKFAYAIKQLELQKYTDTTTTTTTTVHDTQNIRNTRNCKYSNLFIHKPKRTSYMYQTCKEMPYPWDAECEAIDN